MSYAIDHTKGEMVGTVSAQWASRPDDEKFLNLGSLRAQVAKWRAESEMRVVLPEEIKAGWTSEDQSGLTIEVEGAQVQPSHWAFEQVCKAASAPAYYLRTLPAPLAAVALNYGLKTAEQKEVGAYIRQNGSTLLRGLTSPRYGRIFDEDVVAEVMKVAGQGTGDTRWKVPGCIDWAGAHGVAYNPNVEITKQSTTLYASDRDIFLFLVDDLNPIEVGKLANGQPDLMFRGFYVWNSEVGSRTFGFASMYLRGVCQNRNLWGVEGFQEVTFKHTVKAPERFAAEVEPLLHSFAEGGTTKLVEGVQAAKAVAIGKEKDDKLSFLARLGFSQKAAQNILDTILLEEQREAENAWDIAQGITAVARTIPFADQRLKMESVAGSLLDKVIA
jgi:hypothetical protein